jgi:hypothetical protein
VVALEISNANSKFGYREGRSNLRCSYKGLKVVQFGKLGRLWWWRHASLASRSPLIDIGGGDMLLLPPEVHLLT